MSKFTPKDDSQNEFKTSIEEIEKVNTVIEDKQWFINKSKDHIIEELLYSNSRLKEALSQIVHLKDNKDTYDNYALKGMKKEAYRVAKRLLKDR